MHDQDTPPDMFDDDTGHPPTVRPPEPSFRMVGDMAPLFSAKAKARSEFKPIVKDKSVTVFKDGKKLYDFVYADLGKVIEATEKGLSTNGLDLMWFLSDAPDGKTLRCILAHSSGAYIESTITIPPGERPQDLGSALTYARRYQAQCVLGVAPEDDDDGSAAAGMVAVPQPRQEPRRTPPAPQPKPELKAAPEARQEPAKPKSVPPVPMNAAMAEFVADQAEKQGTVVEEELRPETNQAIRGLLVSLRYGATKANLRLNEVCGKPRDQMNQADAMKFLKALQEEALEAGLSI